ncbi:MAG: hypothetical protein RL756_1010 [Pseudomonadota bacterium]|jgi:cation diffusion facilitator CzcD-associated flavoprotein CzcO
MRERITTLPDRVTVLIIGAGPGGLCAGINPSAASCPLAPHWPGDFRRSRR